MRNKKTNIIEGMFIAKKNCKGLENFMQRVQRANSVKCVEYTSDRTTVVARIEVKKSMKGTACQSIFRLGKEYGVRVPRVIGKYGADRTRLQKQKYVVNSLKKEHAKHTPESVKVRIENKKPSFFQKIVNLFWK